MQVTESSLGRAQAAFDAGDLDAALAAFSEILASERDHPEALLGRARCHQEAEAWGKALSDLDRLLQRHPDHREALLERAQLRADEVGLDLALIDLQTALNSSPGDPAILILRGRIFAAHRRYDRAIADLTAAIAANTRDAAGYVERAEVYRTMAFDTEDAPCDAPPVGFARHPLGMMYHPERLQRAGRDYGAAFERDPRPDHLIAQIMLYETGQLWDEAIAACDRLLALAQAGRAGDTTEENDAVREQALKRKARAERRGEGLVEEMNAALGQVLERLDAAAGDGVDVADLRRTLDVLGEAIGEPNKPLGDLDEGELRELARTQALSIWNAIREPNHEYVAVDARQFRHQDLKFYDRARRDLERRGFQWLGDVEPLHNTRATGQRVLMRLMLSRDRRTSAAIYHVQAKRPVWYVYLLLKLLRRWPADLRTIELETEFADGTFIVTNSAGGRNPFQSAPSIDMEQMPRDCQIDALLECHDMRAGEYKARHRPMTEVILRCLDDVYAAQARQHALKRAFRRSIGGVTDQELRSATGVFYDQIGALVREELARMLEEEGSGPPAQG